MPLHALEPPPLVKRSAVSQFDDFVRAYESDEYLPLRRYIETHSFFKALGDIGGCSVLDVG